MSQTCKSCARSWTGKDGRVHCGAPVDDAAIHGAEGVNPIWAERKYCLEGMQKMMKGVMLGMDCEDMDPKDGGDCRMWKAA